MNKTRRSERIVRLTYDLLTRPNRVQSLTDMAERLDSAKSSLSEDLAIIREVFDKHAVGTLETHSGAAGGIRYVPAIGVPEAKEFIEGLLGKLSDADRVLPGGYLYMSDLLGLPDVLDTAGRMFADAFHRDGPEYVVTVETKGIPLAIATARYLDVPTVVVRRDQRVTEGSAVSIHYVSGSRRIQTMSLARRSLPEQSKVLLIDDFMKAGGTIKALKELMKEFSAHVVGVGVFMSTSEPFGKMAEGYASLATLEHVDEETRHIRVGFGTFFEKNRGGQSSL